MSKKALITLNDTYLKSKKIKLTLNGVYNDVKKGFITVDGKYRLIFASFPSRPTSDSNGYIQIQRYGPLRSSSALGNNKDHVWTAPEDGWFKIMLFGSSGSGTYGDYDDYTDDDGNKMMWVQDGDGGGSGCCAASIVKLNKGDTVDLYIGEGAHELTHPRYAEDSKVVFHPTTGETYANLVATAGKNGGEGGKASGGNYVNKNGNYGEQGDYWEGEYDNGILPGNSDGGRAIVVDGRTGTKGGDASSSDSYEDGESGFVVILRGNTN